ncbi:tyrosine-protein kinase receptor Tie-1-like isoform X2 [Ptychodera flava]
MLVPIRWMAPESLATGVYTYKSDIWAYGVLLWEMATLGDIPYPEFQPLDPDFLSRKLCEGYRMPKPARCTDDIYGMMRHCWRNSPDERPTATGLVNNMSGLEICNKGFFKRGGF